METINCDATIEMMADWALATLTGVEDRKGQIKMIATDASRIVGAVKLLDKYGHEPELQALFAQLRIDTASEQDAQLRLSALRGAMVTLRNREQFSSDVEKYLVKVSLHEKMLDELSTWLDRVHGSSRLVSMLAVDNAQAVAAKDIHGRYYASSPRLKEILSGGLSLARSKVESVRLSVIRESLVGLREGILKARVDSAIAAKLSDSRCNPVPLVSKNEEVAV